MQPCTQRLPLARPKCLARCTTSRHFLPFSTSISRVSPPDYDAAREWYRKFSESSLPPTLGEVTYSRSSGPGGQNVNKFVCDTHHDDRTNQDRVNSKAQLRVALETLLPLLPQALHPGIKSSHYYAEKSASLLIQSDESRKQAANREACYRKLNQIVLDVYKKTVPGETSQEQKEHVRQLKKSENESRLRLKKHISNKKSARKGQDD